MNDVTLAPVPKAQDEATDAGVAGPQNTRATIPLVGLGGSAGAIPALREFFASVPPDCGLAFVVVLHLSAAHDSNLAELLQRTTTMRVMQLHDHPRVEANTVYVIPPRKLIEAVDGHLRLADLPAERGRHVAVDLFFRTLAETHGPLAAAIVLSGGDGDGASGIKRIKECGGLTIAQDPAQAEHGGMPKSAIATGMVDWVLPVAEMAPRLLAYFQLEKNLRLPPEDGPQPAQPLPPPEQGSDETLLREVLVYLRTRTGRDFAYYKRATILRRIARRMLVNGVGDLQGYLACLRTQPGEAGALLQDLLISVTNFFRDGECFAALEAQIGGLFQGKGPADTVRVWAPACATGEEAYSLAVLLLEKARLMDTPPMLQVFASDLDEPAIRQAREGIYPGAIEADVSPERLQRYFIREHGGWRVRREVREMVLFAQHDLLKDSPFSRLDLISCRNLLIYLNRDAQQRVFRTFHFALQPQGRLFLGASESVEEASELFSVLDKKCRIFAPRALPRLGVPMLGKPGALGGVADLPLRVAEGLPSTGRALAELPGAGERAPKPLEGRSITWGELHFKLLEALAPPSVLVDARHDILHLSPNAGRFLQYSGGEPSKNLLRAMHPSLRIELRAALSQAEQSEAPAEVVAGPVEIGGERVEVSIRVLPTRDLGSDLFLVSFSVAAAMPADAADTANGAGADGGGAAGRRTPDPVARHLDRELDRLKAHLRDTVEEYEASTEELKASNEELQAMNEELRSATEELETGREELQSMNEELGTVNQELKSRVDELGHTNSDIHNLIDATAIATVFLDREMRITRYTPAAVALFNLIPGDLGRPLADLATRLVYPELNADARRVLERLVPIEREVGLPDGCWFLTRLLPYRTIDDHIGGVVFSLIDITQRRQDEEVRLWLSAVVASSTDAIISASMDQTILSWNAGAEAIFGYSAAEAIGQPLAMLAPERSQEQAENFAKLRDGRQLANFETERRCKNGVDLQVALSMSPIRDTDGRLIGATAIARDITQARRAAEALRHSEERLRMVVENATEYAIFSMDLERRISIWNSGAERLLGYAESEVLGQLADIIFIEEDRAGGAPARQAQLALAEGKASHDGPRRRKDGSRFWASGSMMPMRDARGQAVGFVKILRDETQAREAQQAEQHSQAELVRALQENQKAREELEAADAAKDRFLAVLSHELRNPLASIASASELLAAPELKAADLERATQVVRRQARVMKALLDDLLDVSRLRLGRLQLRRRAVSLASVVEAALETTRPLVEAARHTLAVQLPAEAVGIDADPLRLGQVISNLITNAVKYTPEGGHLSVSAELSGAEVVLTVADDGIGMEAGAIDGMFDLFSQAETASGRFQGGLGIGLALARSIVELHGGWIRARSAGAGQGSQFSVGLPVLRAGSLPDAPGSMVPGLPVPDQARRVVLIADDNHDAAWGIAKLLELSGFQTVLARGGQEALLLAEQHRPLAMLVDIGMPDLGGHEVARRVRATEWGRQMVLIAATGWGQQGDLRKSLASGFDAHLTKPLNVSQILSLIDETAGRRSAA